MAQITSGLRAVLSIPFVYDRLMRVLGQHKNRAEYIDTFVRPFPGIRILDIGCGTARILDYLPTDITYIGFDASAQYIDAARNRYGNRASFFQSYVTAANAHELGEVDLVLATGVVHHLDDDEARNLFQIAHSVLAENGRCLTIDPAYASGQHPFAAWLVSRDRGQNVRDADGYRLLAEAIFPTIKQSVQHHRLKIPYTHCVMECVKSGPVPGIL